LVGRPGDPESDRTPLSCSIWRYHPTRHVFEVVTHGTTNPWGLDWDDYGQLFFSNNVIGHLWHVVPGAHYKRMFGEDFNPFTYGLMIPSPITNTSRAQTGPSPAAAKASTTCWAAAIPTRGRWCIWATIGPTNTVTP